MILTHKMPLDFLDRIPDKLYRRLVTHNYRVTSSVTHSLELRSLGVITVRENLLQGRQTQFEQLSIWLDKKHAQLLHKTLNDQQLLCDCIDNDEYTDDIILRLLDWLDNQRLALKYNQRNAEKPGNTVVAGATDLSSSASNASNKTPHPAVDNQASQLSDEPLLLDQQQIETANAMQAIHQSFAIERQLGWDLSRGLPETGSVEQLLQLHRQVKSSSYLQSIIQLIGRNKRHAASFEKSPGISQHLPFTDNTIQKLPDDHSVNSVSGVFYGDDISRMLASESVLLGHRQLKSLWHARRAEHQLQNYHIRGVLSDHVPVVDDMSILPDKASSWRIRQQGDMVICMDTSASMRGKPEQIARAVVYEIMRVAHLQSRACYLFAFSGAGEITEYDLNLQHAGWQPLVDFLSQSFHGGTDIDGVLQRAFDKLLHSRRHSADLLLVSDGRFKISDNEAVMRFKAHRPSTVLYGLQVSQWSNTAFGDICHQVFNLNNV